MAEKRKDNKGRNLRAGEGQRKDGRFYYRWKDSNGKTSTIYDWDLASLRNKEKEIADTEAKGISYKGGKTKIKDLYPIFLKKHKKVAPSTLSGYQSRWENHILPRFGEMEVADLKKSKIQDYYAELEDRGFKKSTITMLNSFLERLLQIAVDDDMIYKNPAHRAVEGIGEASVARKALTTEQTEKLITFLENSKIYKKYLPLVEFALSTGLRASELSGLRWSDVDMESMTISVASQLIYEADAFGNRGYYFHRTTTKTDSGNREIRITKEIQEALISQKNYTASEGLENIRQEIEGSSDYIFLTRKGAPFTRSQLDDVLARICKAIQKTDKEFPQVTMHLFRHTFASRLAEANMPTDALAKVMGHKDAGVTMRVYAKRDKSNVQEEFEAACNRLRIVG